MTIIDKYTCISQASEQSAASIPGLCCVPQDTRDGNQQSDYSSTSRQDFLATKQLQRREYREAQTGIGEVFGSCQWPPFIADWIEDVDWLYSKWKMGASGILLLRVVWYGMEFVPLLGIWLFPLEKRVQVVSAFLIINWTGSNCSHLGSYWLWRGS